MQEPKKRRQYEVQVSEAKCKICNQLNPASEFPKRATSSNGLNPHCKMCENQLQRERNQKRRERGPIERTVPERKKCSYCNKEKTKNDFGSNQYSKDGLTSKCKACTKAHIDSRDLSMRQAREESGNAKCTACKQKFPLTGFTQSKHDRRCRNCISKARADFMAGNAKEKLRMRVKSRIKNALKAASSPYQHKANREDQPITALIGCNFDELLLHIDPLLARFEDLRYHLSFEDFSTWELDHIQPISRFDLLCWEDCKKAFNYKNMQPLPKLLHAIKTSVENVPGPIPSQLLTRGLAECYAGALGYHPSRS